jgi:hypothetical protein
MAGKSSWIESPRFDLAFFSLAPLLGLAVAAASRAIPPNTLVEGTFFFLGIPHYISSYTFYLGDANLSYYRTRWWTFFLGPWVVIAALGAALALHLYAITATVVALWNVFHVGRQSAGVLSLYRHQNGGNHRDEKLPANAGILGANAAMFLALTNAGSNVPSPLLGRAVPWLAAAIGVVGLVFLARLVSLMSRRSAPASEWCCLGGAIVLFVPFLLVRDFPVASTAMLSGHFVQYLGIVWLLNSRKYRSSQGSWRERFLTAISRNAGRVALFLAIVAVGFFAFDRVQHRFGWNALHAFWLNAIVLLHFYLDGLFWSFKRPYVRQSISPFLLLPYGRARAA